MNIREDFLKMVDTREFKLEDLHGLITLLYHRNRLVPIIRYAKGEEFESLMFQIEYINKQIKQYLNL